MQVTICRELFYITLRNILFGAFIYSTVDYTEWIGKELISNSVIL